MGGTLILCIEVTLKQRFPPSPYKIPLEQRKSTLKSCSYMSKSSKRWCPFFGIFCPPPHLRYRLCLFPNLFLEFVCFLPFLPPFFKLFVFFAKNCIYWWEAYKLKKILKHDFAYPSCTTAPKALNWNKL